MLVQSYLFFDGRCEEAIQFYQKALGAKVDMMLRFKESPEQPEGGEGCAGPQAANGDKIMHASFRIGDTSVMASDGYCQGKPSFQGFSLSISVPNEAEAKKLFAALGDGGQVQQPLIKTFFSPAFGMVADRFGVSWMVHVVDPSQHSSQ
jgi:PhnB protein